MEKNGENVNNNTNEIGAGRLSSADAPTGALEAAYFIRCSCGVLRETLFEQIMHYASDHHNRLPLVQYYEAQEREAVNAALEWVKDEIFSDMKPVHHGPDLYRAGYDQSTADCKRLIETVIQNCLIPELKL